MTASTTINNVKKYHWELVFQLALHSVVFIFFSFDKNKPAIEFHQLVFYANYAIAATIITYILLPGLFYKKKYLLFIISFLLITIMVILIEEYVLEQIYFPDTRGRRFQGLFYGLLDVLPIITILSGLKFAWDLIQKQRELEDMKALMQESELSFLKSQINPHFLFNNLNNLYSYALEGSSKTPEIILGLSSVLRYMIYECRSEFVPLRNELEQLENFVQLSELQVEERGEVVFEMPSSIPDRKIAPLIFMVFVENAFKHSLSSQKDHISIKIKVSFDQDGILNFTCFNSHRQEANNESLSKGIGLVNVRKRLEMIYPAKHQLIIESRTDEYFIKLRLDLN